jgi:hypothetical protein
MRYDICAIDTWNMIRRMFIDRSAYLSPTKKISVFFLLCSLLKIGRLQSNSIHVNNFSSHYAEDYFRLMGVKQRKKYIISVNS